MYMCTLPCGQVSASGEAILNGVVTLDPRYSKEHHDWQVSTACNVRRRDRLL